MDDIFQLVRDSKNGYKVRLWLDNPENDLNQGDEHRFTPLHWASWAGNFGIVELLLARGARISATNIAEDTALHVAASHGHVAVAIRLIQAGADVNSPNCYGNTPLHYAVHFQYEELAYELVSRGAYITVENCDGLAPIDKAKRPFADSLMDHAAQLNQDVHTRIPFMHLINTPSFGSQMTRRTNDSAVLARRDGIEARWLTAFQLGEVTEGGRVYFGEIGIGNRIVVKELRLYATQMNKSARIRIERELLDEARRLRICNHANVLPLLTTMKSKLDEGVRIVTYWMPFGSLFNVLHNLVTDIVVEQRSVVRFAHGIANGMRYLHTLDPPLTHFALNSKHVLLDDGMTPRVSLFDYKFPFYQRAREFSPAWQSPEALVKHPRSINLQAAQCWSYGVLLWEMTTRQVPFAEIKSPMECGLKIASEGLRLPEPPGMTRHLFRMMLLCMNEDPAKRPRFDQLVPILNKIRVAAAHGY